MRGATVAKFLMLQLLLPNKAVCFTDAFRNGLFVEDDHAGDLSDYVKADNIFATN